jgi:Tfp pilus assembly pilus retraction ATPase PilT
MRVDGRLQNLDGPVITSDMAEGLLSEVIGPDLYDEFQRHNEADFAYLLAGVGRFRVNAFRQRGSVGLVLVTGPTGSGKTTTPASMIDHVNANHAVHIVTIEDPIEVLHADKLGIVNQREVDLFPPFQQRQVRLSLAAALQGIIGQRLVRRAGDGGRIAVLEVLVNTGRTAEALADPERLGELGTIMTEGGYYGMQTFDQH